MFPNDTEHARLLKVGALALLLTWPLPLLCEYSGLDLWLEDFFFDPARAIFPWRELPWFEGLTHAGLRAVLLSGLGLNVAALGLSLLQPDLLKLLLPARWQSARTLGYLLLASLSGPLLAGLLKQVTPRACPWNLSRYGGEGHYHHLWDAPVFDLHAPGHCFPGGHAAGGFALLALVPLFSGQQRHHMLVLALATGFLMGWSRMMQGAHFLSHNLWAAWLCWAGVLCCYALMHPVQAHAHAHAHSG